MTGSVSWQSLPLRPAGHRTAPPMRVYRPAPAATSGSGRQEPGWLVWAHGGSWRSGSAEAWHPALADLARYSGANIVGVDYRLAPEHPHPAPLHDVLAALAWAETQAGGAPVAVGGDSAGGTLAASAALVRRDLGLPLAAQVLVYPPLDPDCSAASYHHTPEAFPTRSALLEAWRDHRASSAGPADTSPEFPAGYSTPREAHDLSGVAAAALVVGSRDPVADDVRQYAQALSKAEVTARLDELPMAGHGAFLVSPGFRRRVADAYRAVLAAETATGARR